MDAALVGVILSGLAGLLIAAGQFLGNTRYSRAGVREMRRRDDRHVRQLQVAYTYIAVLEQKLALAGLKAPRRPKELDPEWGLEDDSDELAEKRAEVRK